MYLYGEINLLIYPCKWKWFWSYLEMDSTKTFVGEQYKFHNALAFICEMLFKGSRCTFQVGTFNFGKSLDINATFCIVTATLIDEHLVVIVWKRWSVIQVEHRWLTKLSQNSLVAHKDPRKTPGKWYGTIFLEKDCSLLICYFIFLK